MIILFGPISTLSALVFSAKIGKFYKKVNLLVYTSS